jgi:hypothetical protein
MPARSYILLMPVTASAGVSGNGIRMHQRPAKSSAKPDPGGPECSVPAVPQVFLSELSAIISDPVRQSGYEMTDTVMVEIPVTPEAAEALGDLERRERIGKLVSSMLRPQSPSDDPLASILASIKSLARADGLTDGEVEAELAAYNAERRL